MDIRRFFPVNNKKPGQTDNVKNDIKKRPVISSDDEEIIPESPSIQSNHKTKKKKKVCALSDSEDEDDFQKSKPNKSNHKTKPSPPVQKGKSKDAKKTQLKEVKAIDIFGKAPVHRTPVETKKKDSEKNNKDVKNRSADIGVHMDDDFDQTLLKLDKDSPPSSHTKDKTQKHSNSTKSVVKDISEKIETKCTLEKPKTEDKVNEKQSSSTSKHVQEIKQSSSTSKHVQEIKQSSSTSKHVQEIKQSSSTSKHVQEIKQSSSTSKHVQEIKQSSSTSKHVQEIKQSSSTSKHVQEIKERDKSERNISKSHKKDDNNKDKDNKKTDDRRNRHTEEKRVEDKKHRDESKSSKRREESRDKAQDKRDRSKESKSPSKLKNNELRAEVESEKISPKKNVHRSSNESDFSNSKSRVSAFEKKKAIADKLHGHAKKDFSVFINGELEEKKKEEASVLNVDMDETIVTGSPSRDVLPDDCSTPHAKAKKRKNCDTPELTEEERQERKRYSSMLYKNYLNRSGPKHHGSKQVPEGTPNCLSGLVFIVTGVLDSLEKDEVAEIVTKYGGDFKKSLSGKVTHVIYGEDPGPAKIAKAKEMHIKLLTEDEFLQLIVDKSKNRSTNKASSVKKDSSSDKKRKMKEDDRRSTSATKLNFSKTDCTEEGRKKIKVEEVKIKNEVVTTSKYFDSKNTEIKVEMEDRKDLKNENEGKEKEATVVENEKVIKEESDAVETSGPDVSSIPWVDKYKPQSLKQLIGQQGASSNVAKLVTWLSEWYSNRKINHPKPNPWAKDNKGGYYKAALLSGPPGVGKTTTVGLVCKELGYDTVEFNASDTRSKSLLKEHLSDLVSTNSLAGYVHGKSGKGAVSKKHVVIMDEVDGMAGNEDRGGMQELLYLIKDTSVPIICMCNDKTSQKMRSLTNACFDLTFSRPKVPQIKAAMMSICFKEGVKIPPASLDQIIVGANQDIRQILNLLSLWTVADKNLTTSVEKDSRDAHKDMKLGPWEVVRKVFSQEEHKTMSIHNKSDLFFNDYSLGPLFVQQNYLKVVPKCNKKDVLSKFAEAADCISVGDLVERKIRSNMAWSLLPVQAMYSSVLPGEHIEGHIAGQIEFPSWLGQNSRNNKLNRLAQELHSHTSLSTTGSKLAMRLDYAMHIRDAIINPLVSRGTDGVQEALDLLQTYHLLREDLDSLLELTSWSNKRDPYAMVEVKVKTALTRKYNKEATPLPYSQVSMKKSRSNMTSTETDSESLMESEGATQETIVEEPDVDEDSDLETDAMIKLKTTSSCSSSKMKGTEVKEGKKKPRSAKGKLK